MQSNMCIMSTEALGGSAAADVMAWETDGQIFTARINPKTHALSAPIAMPGAGKGRKHPAVAVNKNGNVLVAWTEGTGWNRGGGLAWQVFDAKGQPVAAETGRVRDGIAAWSTPAVFGKADGGFVVLH